MGGAEQSPQGKCQRVGPGLGGINLSILLVFLRSQSVRPKWYGSHSLFLEPSDREATAPWSFKKSREPSSSELRSPPRCRYVGTRRSLPKLAKAACAQSSTVRPMPREGEPAATAPSQKPVSELSPNSKVKRRKRDAAYQESITQRGARLPQPEPASLCQCLLTFFTFVLLAAVEYNA